MPNYFNQICPVCKKQFCEGDDIVTCPECGTPHHRECYNMIGKCVNHGLHASGFVYSTKDTASSNIQQEPAAIFDEEGEEILVEKKEQPKNNDNNAFPFGASPFAAVQLDDEQYKDGDDIDGVAIIDIASTVRSNSNRFIQVFKKISKSKIKLSWNWGAFFFGSFYLLFRKMYKQGIAFFCLTLTTLIGSEAMLYKFAPKTMETAMQIFSQAVENKANVWSTDMSPILNAGDYSNYQKVAIGMVGVILILRIIEALFADSFYKSTVFEIIKKVNDKLENGSTFTQTSMMFGQNEELSQKRLRQLYLGNRGGVSLFAPFLAYFAMYIILNFI